MKGMKSISVMLLIVAPLLAQHQVTLTSIGQDCDSSATCGWSPDCTCTLQTYRASCVSVGSCPPVSTGSPYTLLPNTYLTANVGASSTAWTFIDKDPSLTDNSIWIYFQTATFANATAPQSPSSPSAPTSPITIPKATATAHQATLNYSNSSCSTNAPCAIQLYRATCTSSTACPSYPNSAFSQLSGYGITVNPSPSGTTWILTDNDPALADSTTYVWVATNSFQSSPGTLSPASAPWSGTTSAPAPAAPPAPTSGPGNTVSQGRKHDKKDLHANSHK